MLERGDGTVEFRRHPGRELLDMVGLPLGAIVFLVASVLMAPAGPIAVIGFGFFGLLMAVGSPASIRRGRKPILVVSPRGIETPEAGFLRWPQVAEVRLEVERAMGGPGRHPRRIGIVPVEGARQLDAGLRLGTVMVDGFLGFVSRMAGEGDRLHVDRAPFSVADWELQVPIERAVEAIERYVPVVDAAAREARRRLPARAATTSPVTIADLREIDARLDPAGGHPSGAEHVPATWVVAPRPIATAVTFRRRSRPASYVRLASAVLPAILIPATLVGMALQADIPLEELPLPFYIAPVGIVLLAGGRALLELRSVSRARRAPDVIAVGPEGIRTPDGGPLAWDEIADVHVAGAGRDRPELVFVPHDPLVMPAPSGEWSWRASGEGRPLRAVTVRADELDGDFDDLVDLVRGYRSVEQGR